MKRYFEPTSGALTKAKPLVQYQVILENSSEFMLDCDRYVLEKVFNMESEKANRYAKDAIRGSAIVFKGSKELASLKVFQAEAEMRVHRRDFISRQDGIDTNPISFTIVS